MELLNEAIQQTIRGLFRYEYGRILPLDYKIECDLTRMVLPVGKNNRRYLNVVKNMPEEVISYKDLGICSYWSGLSDQDEFKSSWVLSFHKKAVQWTGFTSKL